MTGKLKVMGRLGHTTTTWSTELRETVEAANERFNELLGEGYTAFAMSTPTSGQQIREFQVDAETIVLIPRMVGG